MVKMKTTLDLDSVLIIKNYKLISIKKMLDKKGIFSKIYPAPKSILESCAPIITFCSEDAKKIETELNQTAIDFEIEKLEFDIIQELLKK
ncbi:hypothetical protein [Geotoga petraea]|nr:hypothetical protein [Geotoga petraea]